MLSDAAQTIARWHGLTRLPAEEYHADPSGTPSLSASIAHVLDRFSPLHAYTRHPKLGGISRPPTKAFDRGTLSHAILLGRGAEAAIIDAPDYRTKVAQKARDEARAAGKVPVLADEYEDALDVAETLRQRFADHGILLDGESEVTALWTETGCDGSAARCRGMLDHWTGFTIYDLKSCRSAHPETCRRHIDAYGYDIQRAAYVSAVETIVPAMAGRVDFVFVFYELEPPFAVTPVRLSGQFRELGQRRWKRAVSTWAKCLRDGVWPAYVEEIAEVEPMPWALSNDVSKQIESSGWLDDMPV